MNHYYGIYKWDKMYYLTEPNPGEDLSDESGIACGSLEYIDNEYLSCPISTTTYQRIHESVVLEEGTSNIYIYFKKDWVNINQNNSADLQKQLDQSLLFSLAYVIAENVKSPDYTKALLNIPSENPDVMRLKKTLQNGPENDLEGLEVACAILEEQKQKMAQKEQIEAVCGCSIAIMGAAIIITALTCNGVFGSKDKAPKLNGNEEVPVTRQEKIVPQESHPQKPTPVGYPQNKMKQTNINEREKTNGK